MQADFAARAIARLFSFCAARSRGGAGEGVRSSTERARGVRFAMALGARRATG
ncbi:hypothetical protein X946_3461 [Burkholderia sp. ABCPW 111]|nr:hypothetical protein X946_3461 [Burkholderia sp. ABCPW 111]